MVFKNIKLPKIPANIHNLRDYKDFIELIKFAKIINKNVDKYTKQIVYGEYLKTKDEWKEILTEKDYEKIIDFEYRNHASCRMNNDPLIFHSIGDNTFYKVRPTNIAPITGYGGDHFEFEFDIENQKIEVQFITTWGSSRPTGYNMASKIEDIQTFIIDLNTKIIEQLKTETNE